MFGSNYLGLNLISLDFDEIFEEFENKTQYIADSSGNDYHCELRNESMRNNSDFEGIKI
jgi:hypothetical protein